jgi:hypothetical protein
MMISGATVMGFAPLQRSTRVYRRHLGCHYVLCFPVPSIEFVSLRGNVDLNAGAYMAEMRETFSINKNNSFGRDESIEHGKIFCSRA